MLLDRKVSILPCASLSSNYRSMKLIKGGILEHGNQNVMAESEFAEWIDHHQDEHGLHDDEL